MNQLFLGLILMFGGLVVWEVCNYMKHRGATK
jgi:hypothetical protein